MHSLWPPQTWEPQVTAAYVFVPKWYASTPNAPARSKLRPTLPVNPLLTLRTMDALAGSVTSMTVT